MTSIVSAAGRRNLWPLACLAVPLALLVWAYWTTLQDLSRVWAGNASYSHGYLVPLFAIYLLWFRRGLIEGVELRPSLLGLPLLAVSLGMRWLGTYFFFAWLDPLSLLPAVAGVFLLVGGWRGLRWAWPASLFLFFMVPLPFSVSSLLSGPLQRLATICSTFLMQMLGLPAVSEGNTILVNEASIGVVEACSGLRMLMVFFALSSAAALIIQRSWVEKTILLASAIPIALLVNILRITATGVLHELVSSDTANAFFHDVAGWFMMPLALALLWCEYKVLINLIVPAGDDKGTRRQGDKVNQVPAPLPSSAPRGRSGRSRPLLPPTPRPLAQKRRKVLSPDPPGSPELPAGPGESFSH